MSVPGSPFRIQPLCRSRLVHDIDLGAARAGEVEEHSHTIDEKTSESKGPVEPAELECANAHVAGLPDHASGPDSGLHGRPASCGPPRRMSCGCPAPMWAGDLRPPASQPRGPASGRIGRNRGGSCGPALRPREQAGRAEQAGKQ